jgi:large subunit ribosomal protein L23
MTSVIIKPRITEKAALLGEANVYTFEVQKGANKYEVRDAIKALYNVTPTRIHMVHQETSSLHVAFTRSRHDGTRLTKSIRLPQKR